MTYCQLAIVLLHCGKLLPDVVAEAVEYLVSPNTFMKKPVKKYHISIYIKWVTDIAKLPYSLTHR